MERIYSDRVGSIIEALPFGFLLISNTGIITMSNSKTSKIIEMEISEIIGKSFVAIFHTNSFLQKVLTKQRDLLNQTINLNNKELLFSFSCYDNNEYYKKEIICTIQYACDHKQLNQIEMLNKELETIINASFDEIFVTNGEGTVLRVNPAGEALYGLKAEQIVGKNATELGKKGLYSPTLYPIIKERKERVSMIQRTKTGKTVHVIGNPVFNSEGDIEIIIFTSRDLTEIRQLRAKMERTESLLDTYKAEFEELTKFQKQPDDLIAYSPNMRILLKLVNKIALVDSTVLLTGESGVGKGVIASTIHKRSSRNSGPLIQINCGAIPESLIESELFGYDGGAFTGAKKEGKKGLIEEAHGGTLFLDEIGEMPLSLQVKLLKTLQERVIYRVGGTKNVEVDIRIIAATNKDIETLVEEGKFREDLFYRLNVIPIHIPPLRTRPEDISYLIDYFLNKYNEKYHFSTYLSLEAENALIQYDWPGNVRQLENIIERLVVTTENKEISVTDLHDSITKKIADDQYFVHVRDICSLKQAQEEMEEQLIRKAYDMLKSSYKIADVLGINQSTAIRKIQKYLKNNLNN